MSSDVAALSPAPSRSMSPQRDLPILSSSTSDSSVCSETSNQSTGAIVSDDSPVLSLALLGHHAQSSDGTNDDDRYAVPYRSPRDWAGTPVASGAITSSWDIGDRNTGSSRGSSPVEVRSSVSSPGKYSLRERLKQRMLHISKRNRSQDSNSPDFFIYPKFREDNKGNRSQDSNSPDSFVYPKFREDNSDILSEYNDGDDASFLFGNENNEEEDSSLQGHPVDRYQRRHHHHRTLIPKNPFKRLSRHESIGDDYDNSDDSNNNNTSVLRLSRQVRYGRRGELPVPERSFNRIQLHIYDLMASETIMQLPWGCDFPIGQCFTTMNSGLHALGTGAYHCGIEVNGIEYAYGASELKGASGVFTCIPKYSPGYEYRTTIDFGEVYTTRRTWVAVPAAPEMECDLDQKSKRQSRQPYDGTYPPQASYREVETFLEGHEILREMAAEYKGVDYDLLRNNCCTFARDACLRLGVTEEEIPSWFMNLAGVGAITQAMAEDSIIKPFQEMLSFADTDSNVGENVLEGNDDGFEVIAKRKEGSIHKTEMQIVKVVEAVERHDQKSVGVRQTLSWTY